MFTYLTIFCLLVFVGTVLLVAGVLKLLQFLGRAAAKNQKW